MLKMFRNIPFYQRVLAIVFVAISAAVGVFYESQIHRVLYGAPPPVLAGVGHDMKSSPEAWLSTERPFSTFLSDASAGSVEIVGVNPDGLLVSTKGAKYFVADSVGGVLSANVITLLREGKLPPLELVSVDSVRGDKGLVGAIASMSDGSIRYLNTVLYAVLVALMLFMVLPSIQGDYRFVKSDTKFDDVVGASEAKEALKDIVAYLKNPKLFEAVGAKPPRGVLMTGAPGTGKTLLAKALAGECGVPFICVSGSDFSSKFFGMGIQKVKSLFSKARKHAPAIVFIDEIDGVGKRTHGGGGAAEAEANRIINQVLVEMDGFGSGDHVVVIAATNFPDALDPALIRDGRFDRRVPIMLPDVQEREEVFALYAKNLPVSDDIDCRQLARMSSGLAPVAIAAIVNRAAIIAATNGQQIVTQSDFLEAIEIARMGAKNGNATMLSEEDKRRIAVHEAGHTIMAQQLAVGEVEKVSILPRGGALGVTLITQTKDQMLFTKEEVEAHIQFLLAGRCAEKLVLGSISTGAANDLERASGFALSMVLEYGLGENGHLFSHKALAAVGLPGADVTAAQTAAEAILQRLMAETEEFLTKQKEVIDTLANKLLEREEISGDEMKSILSA